jgi:nucleotide-binding universal stress UspA family protein
MKVLVPVDGSRHAEEALYQAIDLLKAKGGELFVLTVVPSFEALDLEISAGRRESLRQDFEARGGRVVNKACDIATGEGVPARCKAEVTATNVPEAIVEFAAKEETDLIVIGSRGLSPSSRWRMGSVASKVVRHASCSVWVVKLPAAARG